MKQLKKDIENRLDVSIKPVAADVMLEVQITPFLNSSPISTPALHSLIGKDISQYLKNNGINEYLISTDPGEKGGADSSLWHWFTENIESLRLLLVAHKEQILYALRLVRPLLRLSKNLYGKYSRRTTEIYIRDYKPFVTIQFCSHIKQNESGFSSGETPYAANHTLFMLPQIAELLSSSYCHVRFSYSVMAVAEGRSGHLLVNFGDKLPSDKLCSRLIKKINSKRLNNNDDAEFNIGRLDRVKAKVTYRYRA